MSTRLRSLLSQSPLLRTLAPAELDRLAARCVERRFADRQTIFCRGDAGSSMLIVTEGRVRISVSSAEGREVRLAIVEPGQVFGELALLDGGERSADATAMGDCVVCVLERRELLDLLRRSPEAASRLLALLCERVRATTERLEGRALIKLPVRLARLLRALAYGQGEPALDHPRMRIALSQSELARRIGASRQKVNLHLGRWCADGLLEREGAALVIRDPARLTALAGGNR